MFGFGNWWQSLWTNGCIELYLKDVSIGISWSPCVGFKEFMRWPKCFSRNCPKIGHVSVELIANMSWRRRLCDHSCLPSRHHPNKESWKDSRLIKTKSKNESSWSTHKAYKMYWGIKWSHGMVSIINYALCTNPWSSWELFVGLGCGVQVLVKHHEEIKCLKLAIHYGDNGLVKMCGRVAHP